MRHAIEVRSASEGASGLHLLNAIRVSIVATLLAMASADAGGELEIASVTIQQHSAGEDRILLPPPLSLQTDAKLKSDNGVFPSAAIDEHLAEERSTFPAKPIHRAALDDSFSGSSDNTAGIQFQHGRLLTDLRELPHSLWSDVRAMPTLHNAIIIGGGAALAGVSAAYWDDDVRQDTTKHKRRWSGFDDVLDVTGHPGTHLALVGVTYGLSFPAMNDESREFSKAALNSLLLTDAAVLILKYSFDTQRPDGSGQGFPSGHAASSFALAAVIEERHGFLVGAGAYTIAGLVGFSRIDSRKHDLSDVLFGSALGYAIGKTVARNHFLKQSHVEFFPFVDPVDQSAGIMVHRRF